MMYNLTVEKAHTFFVGQQQWLVHNTCQTWNEFQQQFKGTFKANPPEAGKPLSAPAHAAAGWKAYQSSRDATTVLAIGRQTDTALAAKQGYSILAQNTWSLKVNDAWVQGGIDIKKPFFQVSPRTNTTLWDAANNRPTVFWREREQLFKAGYTEVEDIMKLTP